MKLVSREAVDAVIEKAMAEEVSESETAVLALVDDIFANGEYYDGEIDVEDVCFSLRDLQKKIPDLIVALTEAFGFEFNLM